MSYIPTQKTINTLRHERQCPHCGAVVTSMRSAGLPGAFRKHLEAKHKEIYEATRRVRVLAPVPALRPTIECPYCHEILSSTRESQLSGLLTRHKRNRHENEFADEIAARNETALRAAENVELTEVPVIRPYYTKSHLASRYPAPKTVMVPAGWNVTGVFVKCCADGHFVAYRGRMGASEAWEVGG